MTCLKQYNSLKTAYPMTIGESKTRNESSVTDNKARGSTLDLVQNEVNNSCHVI